MWPFNYFKKKREEEEQELRRAEENARSEKLELQSIAREREKRLEEDGRKEQARQEEFKEKREQSKIVVEKENGEKTSARPIKKPETCVFPVDKRISDYLDCMACQCNLAFNMGNQSSAVTWMNKLFEACYAGNGHKLLQIESKATQPIGFAFANIALYLDFDDEDMNSVAAENAIYCLGRSMIESNNSFCAPPLFKILQKRRNLLNDKLIATHCEISQRRVGMPIGIMLGGNPYTSPQLKEFREQAIEEKSIDIKAYLLENFFDTVSGEYKIPTDLHIDIPSKTDIGLFINQEKTIQYDKNCILREGEEYFFELFVQCQETLKKMV
jgi:hypothetical protein